MKKIIKNLIDRVNEDELLCAYLALSIGAIVMLSAFTGVSLLVAYFS